jgi:hypothetical protein
MRSIFIIPILAGLVAIPATVSTASAHDRVLSGAALGATAGVVIAGPVGAVVGGVAGAAIGGPPLTPYVRHHHGTYLNGRACYDMQNRRIECPPVRRY